MSRSFGLAPTPPPQPASMRDFPKELVSRVVDELFYLVGRESYPPSSDSSGPIRGISKYSLVSKAWVYPTQKHYFSTVEFDCPALLKKWATRIPADPTGVSRHLRDVALFSLDSEYFDGFEDHLDAFTRIECLTFHECDGVLQRPRIMEWFVAKGSSLVELRISSSPVTPHLITSLLAVLPLLRSLEIHNFTDPGDAHDTNLPTPPRIPFFEGANHFVLRSDHGYSYPEGTLDWIPTSARFGRLEVDMACSLDHPDLVNRWLASSRATLTNLTIREDPEGMSPPKGFDVHRFVPLTELSLSSRHPR